MASKFSVVMAVYAKDRAEWFEQAIESVLSQTIPSDDIIVVADGPITDKLEDSLREYSSKGLISVIRLEENLGLGNALNVGIDAARHELIARMDSDDIAVSNRFEIQAAEFAKNAQLDILGGQIAEFVTEPENIVSYRNVPLTHSDIKKFAKRRSPFNHPTVMYKKSVIQSLGGYDITALRIEDYDLWLRAINSEAACANVGAILLKYRSSSDAMRRRKTYQSLKSHIAARRRFYSKKYISFSDMTYGIVTQTVLFVLPAEIAKTAFNRLVRK